MFPIFKAGTLLRFHPLFRSIFLLGALLAFAWARPFVLSPDFVAAQKAPLAPAILKDYERFINEIASETSLHVTLQKVNLYLNAIVPLHDANQYASEDYWATRGEFLARGGGDCEDYAISKYYTLKDLGISPSSMGLCVVHDRYSGVWHMVLAVQTPDSPTLVLDNLSFNILPFSLRTDLRLEVCMNEEHTFSIDAQDRWNSLNPSPRFPSFIQMLERAKRERIWK